MVSHSRALAEAAVGLASEMVAEGDRPVIAVAAGLDETTFGTDAAAVAEAIGAADSADGVLVLLDLGSAVLSAELALEFVDPEVAERVKLSSAPLVEGLVAAVVTASTGAPLDAVLAEASRGLAGKQDHLGDAVSEDTPLEVAPDSFTEVVVSNEHGLHARPAAKVVGLAQRFDAQVTLTNLTTGKGPVDAGSLSMVATLNAQQGHRLRISASGPDANEAVVALGALADRGFDDAPAQAAGDARIPVGRSGSGLEVAIGPAIVADEEVDLSGYQAGDVDVERERAKDARRAAEEQLTALRDETAKMVGAAEAAIFDAQLAMLDDVVLLDSVFRAITQGEDKSAPEAWKAAMDALASTFEGLDDPYQRERAQDVRSVRDRVLRALIGVVETAPADGGSARSTGAGCGDCGRRLMPSGSWASQYGPRERPGMA